MNIFSLAGLSVTISCAFLSLALLFFGRTRLHSSLLAFNIVVAFWGFGLFLVGIAGGEGAAIMGWKIAHAGGFFVGPTFYHFVTTFCGVRRRRLIIFGYLQAAIFLALLLGTDVLFQRAAEAHGILFMIPRPAYLPGFFVYAFFVLLSYVELMRFLPSTSGRKRSQLLYIIFGFLFGFSGASLTFFPIFGLAYFSPWGNFGITLYSMVLAYAILRHRIMDIHVVFRKSLVYALSAGFLTGLFVMLVLVATRYLSQAMGISSFTVTVVAAIAIAFLFAPLKNLIQATVDRIFFRDSYDYYTVVRETSRRLLSTVDMQQIYHLVVDTLSETLGLSRALLLAAGSDGYEAVYSVVAEGTAGDSAGGVPAGLGAESPLVGLVQSEGMVLREELEEGSEEAAREAVSDLVSLGCDAAFPVRVGGEPKFLLLLGGKRSGDSFTDEDLNLLRTLSNQSAIALKNAALFEDLSSTLVQLKKEVDERARAEDALIKSSDDWRTTFDSTMEAIIMVDRENRVVRANRTASVFFDTPLKQLPGKDFFDPFQGRASSESMEMLSAALRSGCHEDLEIHLEKDDRWLHVTFDPLRSATSEEEHGAVCTIRDTTEQKRLQTQIVQSRKMESVGRMAGGVAHDFNNLLFTIIGYSELVLDDLAEGSSARERLELVTEAAEKAAGLTRQLLAFSRKQVLEMKAVDILEIVSNMTKILSRTIGEDIEVEIRSTGVVRTIKADPVQLEQVIMNFALNARDAMPRGGRFMIEARTLEIEDEGGGLDTPPPGEYVLLTITDTGEGMTAEVQERIFEPFFTTKELGKGTGLGLATVYGIIKQHDSHITVSSSPGGGTTFRVYFPALEEAEIMEPGTSAPGIVPRGTERIMVVEDDSMVRALVLDTLKPLGYQVLSAGNGEEALEELRRSVPPVDLILTDVIMPGMNGKELATRVARERPGTKILYMSGYPDEIVGRHGDLEGGELYLQKPVSPPDLARKVRDVLDAP